MGVISAADFRGLRMAERNETLQRQLSRRGVLRAAIAGVAGTTLSPTLLARADPAGPAPLGGAWLGFGTDASSTMNVNWEIRGLVRRARLRYGVDTLDQSIDVDVEPLHTVLPTGEMTTQYYAHATLADLNPATQYRYQVEHQGIRGLVRHFTTAAAPDSTEPFTFTAVGDQSITDGTKAITYLIGAQRPAFHLVAGDIAYADKDGRGLATDDLKSRRWTTYFRTMDTVSSQVPWMVAPGNHEMEAVHGKHGYAGFLERFRLPETGPKQAPTSYVFRYANVAVVSLDANDVSTEITANTGYSGNAQTGWLRETLAALRADRSIDFIVLFFHQCAYSTCDTHGSDSGVRSSWARVIDEFYVDLVINGHNHVYERTDPLRGGSVGTSAPHGTTVDATSAGTTYVVVGGGGAGLGAFSDEPTETADHGSEPRKATLIDSPDETTTEEVTWSRTRYQGFSLLVVQVQPAVRGGEATMALRALDRLGREIDSVTLTRRRPDEPSPLPMRALWVAGGAGLAAAASGVTWHRHRRTKPAGAPAALLAHHEHSTSGRPPTSL